MEFRHPFGWQTVNEKTLHYIREKLRAFESRTLNEVFIASKKQSHAIPITDLCREAQRRLEDLKLFDVDELYSLHLSGTERVWGFVIQNVFNLLWWDPNHLVCPSEKKHT